MSIWCSVVTAFTGGMSVTCLRSTAVTGAFFRDFPQQEHLAGIQVQTGTLEDVFLSLTGREYRA